MSFRNTILLAALFLVAVTVAWLVFLQPSTPTAIAGKSRHVCSIEAGNVKCWGDNTSGQLGTGEASDWSDTPTLVAGLSDVVSVSPRDNHTCAVKSNGTAWCWGGNRSGQLGNGTLESSRTPVQVNGITDATAVAAGVFHSCALLSGGKVVCWGYNAYGQLGDGTTADSPVPVLVAGLPAATALGAGGDHNCVITTANEIYCWGWNAQGQIGAGLTDERVFSPTLVSEIDDPVQVSNGDYHTCALTGKGRVWCWGLNGETAPLPGVTVERDGDGARVSWGEFGGRASYTVHVSGRPAINGIKGLSYVVSGLDPDEEFAFKVTANYSGFLDGQLGNGTFQNSNVPTQVAGIDNAVQIDAGYANTCARLKGGGVTCWGRNRQGQLGGDRNQPASSVPVMIDGIDDATDIATTASPCVIRNGNSIICWGWRLPPSPTLQQSPTH